MSDTARPDVKHPIMKHSGLFYRSTALRTHTGICFGQLCCA